MAFCLRCQDLDCDLPGIISVSFSVKSNNLTAGGDCDEYDPDGSFIPPVDFGSFSTRTSQDKKNLPGPAIGTISITAYAYLQGEDKWGDSRCQGTAQASQTFSQKFDLFTNKYYLLPSEDASASITGDIGSLATITDPLDCDLQSYTARSVNGAPVVDILGTDVGSGLSYVGSPIAVDFPFDGSYTVFGKRCYLTSINVSVNFPTQPATVSYSFQFIEEC